MNSRNATTAMTGTFGDQSLTQQDVLRAVREVSKIASPVKQNPSLESLLSVAGLKIVEAPVHYEPRMKLCAGLPLTDEFRAEMDLWLLDFFGTKEVCSVPKGQMFVLNNHYIVARPEMAAVLRNISV